MKAIATYAAQSLAAVRTSFADRTNFALQVAVMAVNNGFWWVLWALFFLGFREVGGWRLGDVARMLGVIYVLFGLSTVFFGGYRDMAGAIPELQKAKIPNPGAWYQGYLGYAYGISGDRAKAKQALRELEELAKQQYVSPTAFATIYLGLGEKEKCLDWLEKAYEQQDSACWYLNIDQIYDGVRNEPRFQALVQKVFRGNP